MPTGPTLSGSPLDTNKRVRRADSLTGPGRNTIAISPCLTPGTTIRACRHLSTFFIENYSGRILVPLNINNYPKIIFKNFDF